MDNRYRLLSPKQGWTQLGCGKTRFHQLLASGKIPSFMLGGSRRIRLTDLEVFIDAQAEQVP